jgi:hypothetical protein
MSGAQKNNEEINVDRLDFDKTIHETRTAVWRLLHYAVSDANRDLADNKPGLIRKVMPALQKDPSQLSDSEVSDLLEAYNDLSRLVFPATNESLWLKEKVEQDERATINGGPREFSSTSTGVKRTYIIFRWALWIVGILFLFVQGYTYFLSDTLQNVAEYESALRGIEAQIDAAKKTGLAARAEGYNETKQEGASENTISVAESPLKELFAQRQVIWMELNGSYCTLRKVSFVWGWLYPNGRIACDTATGAEKNNAIALNETSEKAARDTFFGGAKAILRVCNYLLLPTLLGSLGSLAYVIRGVLESFSRSSFVLGARRRWGMRVALGPLLGLISGIVVSPDLEDFKEISFSPLIWAFLMGYSVEFAFSLFDSLIEKGRQAVGYTHGKAEGTEQKQPEETNLVGRKRPALLPVPQVKMLQPSQGSVSGGTDVVITGTGFTSDATVSFGTHPAKAITVLDESRIVATSPPGAGTIKVTVTTLGGSSSTDAASEFTYVGLAAPQEDESETHICDFEIPIEDVTSDEELPAAVGGVA